MVGNAVTGIPAAELPMINWKRASGEGVIDFDDGTVVCRGTCIFQYNEKRRGAVLDVPVGTFKMIRPDLRHFVRGLLDIDGIDELLIVGSRIHLNPIGLVTFEICDRIIDLAEIVWRRNLSDDKSAQYKAIHEISENLEWPEVIGSN